MKAKKADWKAGRESLTFFMIWMIALAQHVQTNGVYVTVVGSLGLMTVWCLFKETVATE